MTGTTARSVAPVAIGCRGLTVELGGRLVLDQLDLNVETGQWLGVIGPNGAGKSTLLRAIAGLVAHSGDVMLDTGGRPAAADVAVVPQIPVIPAEMTVSEYVLIGRTAHLGWLAQESRRDRTVVADVLRRLDLSPFAGRPMSALSGGETQRVVIARALAQEAPILLLDEPTSALDIGHQTGVLELVHELRSADGLTVIAVMHDLTTAARFADRLVLLHQGRIVADGSPDHTLDAEILSATYDTPLAVKEIDGHLVVLPAVANRSATDRGV